MTKRQAAAFGMFSLGLGYFLWYTPYSGLTKAMSGGFLPSGGHPVGGLILLPATVLGQLAAMPVFVLASGWWRYAHRRRLAGRQVPFPTRHTAESALWMAFIVGTTTLNFTFPGASIVFMLVLMRIGTLVISPTVDLVRRRKIHWYSTVALVLCLGSAAIALADIDNYKLTTGAVLSIGGYCVGYFLRFRVMSAHAKSGDQATDRQYFIEEHMTTPVLLLLLVGVPALIGQGPWMHALREGFSSFLTTSAALPALLIGVCYEGLFIMTSLIFLDRREFSFCTPVHVCSSLLAGIVASLGLHGIYDLAQPSSAQYVAASTVIVAALALSYPTVKARLALRQERRSATLAQVLFVCGGNTCRSPMAAAIARAELAGRSGTPRPVASAGVAVKSPGAPMTPEAVAVLRDIGVDSPGDHHSRQLTVELCADSEVVYCMTQAQRDAVVALAPRVAERTFCLDPAADVPDPVGQSLEVYRDCALRLRTLVSDRLRDLQPLQPLSASG